MFSKFQKKNVWYGVGHVVLNLGLLDQVFGVESDNFGHVQLQESNFYDVSADDISLAAQSTGG